MIWRWANAIFFSVLIDAQPYVIPTTHARVDQQLYIHGSAASRMLRTLTTGVPVCITVTLLDGLVLARSTFHHSMKYRSVVILGAAAEVTDPDALVKYDCPTRKSCARSVRWCCAVVWGIRPPWRDSDSS